MVRRLVILLERACPLFHWIPGWRCTLAYWSAWLDSRFGTGEWVPIDEEQNAPKKEA